MLVFDFPEKNTDGDDSHFLDWVRDRRQSLGEIGADSYIIHAHDRDIIRNRQVTFGDRPQGANRDVVVGGKYCGWPNGCVEDCLHASITAIFKAII